MPISLRIPTPAFKPLEPFCGLERQGRGTASNTSYCPATHLLRNQSIGMILRRTEYSSRLESA